MYTNRELVKRYDQLYSQRSTIQSTWDLIEQYIAPIRGGKFFSEQTSEHELQSRRPEVYDDTAITSSDNLAASLHGNLTSSSLQWFEFRFRDPAMNENVEAKQWMERAAASVFNALQDSNFDLEISEGYLDLVDFGNACMTQEWDEKNGKLLFQSVPIRESFFEQSHDGTIEVFIRRYQWTALQIQTKFGEEGLPDAIVNSKDPDMKFDVLFCIYPRNKKDVSTSPIAVAAKRPYGKKYIFKQDASMLGEEGGYYEMPATNGRWRKASGSRWGYGPGNIALPTVITLNTLVEMILESAEKVVDPANLVTERGLLSDLDLGPRGLTVVRDLESSLKPYESRARFDVSALQVEDLRAMVMRIFLADQLDMKESPAMTATEVQFRFQRMARMLGSTLSRIQSEILTPHLTRGFNILHREKVLPELPEVLNGVDIDYEIYYTGPLARAQRSDTATSMANMLSVLAQATEVYPQAIDVFDPDKFIKLFALNSGVPAEAMRTDRELKQLRAQQQEQAQAQQQLALDQQDADIDKTQAEADNVSNISQGQGS